MDLILLFKTLKQRFWVLLLVPFVAAVFSFLLTLDSLKTYRSTAQLSTGYTITDPTLLVQRVSPYESGVMFNNLIASLSSPRLISLLGYRLIIHDLEAKRSFREIEESDGSLFKTDVRKAKKVFQAKLDSMNLLSSFDPYEVELLSLLDSYGYSHNKIMSSLKIYREGHTDYVTIDFVSENPELSAFVVNTLCEEYFRYSGSLRLERASESVKTLAKFVDQKRTDLRERTELLRRFKASQGVLNFDLESENKMSLLTDLEKSLEDERKEARGLKLQLDMIEKQLGVDSASTVKNLSNEKILVLRENIQKINQEYIRTNNPNLLSEIKNLRQELQKEIANINNGGGSGVEVSEREALRRRRQDLGIKLAIAEQNIASVTNRLSSIRRDANSYASKEAQMVALERDVELATQEYLEAQNNYNDALNKTSSLDSQVKQVAFGQPAVDPEPSKRKVITLISSAGSFVLCFLALIFIEYIDLSIKTPSIFQKQVDLPLKGVIGKVKGNEDLLTLLLEGKSKDKRVYLEQLRKVRYELEASGQKAFLFTSLAEGGGKTTLIKSLSYVLTLNGKSVIIIDTNFSNNELTEWFDVPPTLKKIVDKAADFDPNSLKKKGYINNTAIKNIDIIGNKGDDSSPSEILMTERFGKLLSSLKKEYDIIMLECANLNKYSDTKELASHIDGVIGVFSAKDTVKKNADKQSINYLKTLGSKFMGVLLNKVEANNIEL